MIKLIITDLDNTLLNDKKEISPYSVDILSQCQKRGIQFAFATARPERATRLNQKLLEPDYIISNNGATISHKNSVIFNNVIEADIRNCILAQLTKIDEVACITVEAGECLYTNYLGESLDNENWNPVYFDFNKLLDVDVVKISIESKDKEWLDNFILKYPNLHFYNNTGEDWSQIMHVGSTKMNAINYLVKTLGIGIGDVVAFGDDFNDIEMIKNCGLGIAVENAITPVKQVADFICMDNNEDGVAKWIETNILC